MQIKKNSRVLEENYNQFKDFRLLFLSTHSRRSFRTQNDNFRLSSIHAVLSTHVESLIWLPHRLLYNAVMNSFYDLIVNVIDYQHNTKIIDIQFYDIATKADFPRFKSSPITNWITDFSQTLWHLNSKQVIKLLSIQNERKRSQIKSNNWIQITKL